MSSSVVCPPFGGSGSSAMVQYQGDDGKRKGLEKASFKIQNEQVQKSVKSLSFFLLSFDRCFLYPILVYNLTAKKQLCG